MTVNCDEDNLWGDIDKTPPLPSPADILQRQAEILREKTGHKVIAKVLTNADGQNLRTTISICAARHPAHEMKIVSIVYGLALYPARVVDHIKKGEQDAGDEADLRRILRAILSSSDVHNFINRMRRLEIQ